LEEDLRPALGRRVRELRRALGLSQERLAERADLHWTYVSGIERGLHEPGLNVLSNLAKALEVSLPDFVAALKPSRRRATKPRGRRPLS
jgi:transcriptional regulator with XRE-family HTH domain